MSVKSIVSELHLWQSGVSLDYIFRKYLDQGEDDENLLRMLENMLRKKYEACHGSTSCINGVSDTEYGALKSFKF